MRHLAKYDHMNTHPSPESSRYTGLA